MAVSKAITCLQLSFDNTTTGGKVANLGGVQRVILKTSADCYVDFDQPVSTSESYKILAANGSDTTIEVTGGSIQNLYCLGASGSGTLFIIAIVN